jgi:pyridine nucleotide-disulfide oxidoreductase family protein
MKHLLLLGGGHAHLGVLRALAIRPLPGWRITLLTPHARQLYSGMLPGWVAGHYPLQACAIDLARLSARASVELRCDAATALDAAGQIIATAQGRTLRYDALSIDVGSAPAIASLAGGDVHGVPIRPIERFATAWTALVERLRANRGRFDLTVLGAGAAGVELAFAARERARAEGWTQVRVHLVGADALPLPALPMRARHMALALLRERGIAWHGQRRAIALCADGLHFQGIDPLRSDATWVVTGSAAAPWLAHSALATDAQGFVRVNAALQSISHPAVFAAGDIASHPAPLPRSGVYAVRAGPSLARNLAAFCQGQPLAAWQPQRRALYLLSTGDGAAMGVWGRWCWRGRWMWRWKDWIDRRFVASFDGEAPVPPP